MLTIRVPDSDENFIEFSSELTQVPEVEAYQFDFGAVRFATPAWMLVVGDALRLFRDEKPNAKRRAANYKHLGYAAHAGFFQFFGLNFGHVPAAVKSTNRFIPITTLRTEEIRNAAFDQGRHHGDIIQTDAERLVEVLLQTDSGDAFETLAYSLREIARNVIEHSGSDDYSFAAQYWPGAARAEIAISDHGIGIARSLCSNPRYSAVDEQAAIDLAVQPGVSSKIGRKRRADDVWANSGYGLYMVKGLCARGGSFSIISGSKAATWQEDAVRVTDAHGVGTTVIMRMDGIGDQALSDRLADLRKDAAKFRHQAAAAEPSTASMSLKVRSPE